VEKKITAVENVKAAEEKEKKIATSEDQLIKYLSSMPLLWFKRH
jgi:hypothetical protein